MPHLPQDYVATPGGYRHQSLVHYIEPGNVVDGGDSSLFQLSSEGEQINEFALRDQIPLNMPFMPRNIMVWAAFAAMKENGWVADSSWLNRTGTPISFFATTWRVPPPPTTYSGQLLYLFNGIQSLSPLWILQPVLQWGVSPAGGGPNWQLASWYVGGPNEPAMHSRLVSVDPGDTVVGIMELTGQSSAGFSYSCRFDGFPATELKIQNRPELTWAVETLEVYNVSQASNYPATQKVSMAEISIETGGSPAPLQWFPENRITTFGQHVDIVNGSPSGGSVDIFFS